MTPRSNPDLTRSHARGRDVIGGSSLSWVFGVILTLLSAPVTHSWAAERCSVPAKAAKSVNLLIVTGGHPYEPSEFFRAFDGITNVHYDHVLMMEAKPVAVPAGGLRPHYDVVLFYDMEDKLITPEWRDLLDRGDGLVFLHHAIGSFPGSPEYKAIVGGHGNFFPEHWPGVPNSIPYENTLQHYSIVDREHPVTCGTKDFEMVEEPYDDVDIDPSVHALIRSDYPKHTPIVAWTWSHAQKRVLYIQMGHGSLGLPPDHGPTAYENASFLKLLARGIYWTAGRL
jgi:uncharacterized protein